ALLLGAAQARSLRVACNTLDPFMGAEWVTGIGSIAAATGPIVVLFVLPAIGPRWMLAVLGAVLCAAQWRTSRSVTIASAAATVVTAVAVIGPTYLLGTSYDSVPILRIVHGREDTTAV